ncbi:hypothetical protein HAX54_025943 [Datura stramonium]|uniref:Uncharacterized protein n=1 Tax=Datura stramonium TaxID=4076 RepID=A0ABS8Y7X5_DATST|nr:hypothetical protein [Datura stramonium]
MAYRCRLGSLENSHLLPSPASVLKRPQKPQNSNCFFISDEAISATSTARRRPPLAPPPPFSSSDHRTPAGPSDFNSDNAPHPYTVSLLSFLSPLLTPPPTDAIPSYPRTKVSVQKTPKKG